jgi:hypothetical protein
MKVIKDLGLGWPALPENLSGKRTVKRDGVVNFFTGQPPDMSGPTLFAAHVDNVFNVRARPAKHDTAASAYASQCCDVGFQVWMVDCRCRSLER